MEPHPEYDRILAVVAAERAPAGLRTRIETERERAASPRVAIRRRLRTTGGLAAAAAVAGVVVALVAPAGGAPSVFDAAALASRGPALSAPAVNPDRPEQLDRSVDGVAFPVWKDRFPWHAVGQRTDRIEGRRAVTVFYDDPDGVRLGYTIVSGSALDWPTDGRRVVRSGTEIHVLRHQGRVIATWRERGHQCVISAPAGVPESRMIALASADVTQDAGRADTAHYG